MKDHDDAPWLKWGPDIFKDVRQRYEHGAPLRVLKRRFHLSRSEMEDIAPEEFMDSRKPDGRGGY